MHISVKCSVAVHCLIFMNEAGSHRVTSKLLAVSTGCNAATIRSLFCSLRKAGIIEVSRGEAGAHLVRKPGDITLLDIQNAVEPDGLSTMIGVHKYAGQSCPVAKNIRTVLAPAYAKVEQAAADSMSAITLAQLIDDYHIRLAENQDVTVISDK